VNETIFVAGASGAVGMRLVPLLVQAGHVVYGTTRSPGKAPELAALGARPVVVDVYDVAALSGALVSARPDVVISQLTDLPDALSTLDQPQRTQALERNARMRTEGMGNLVAAALKSGAERLIAQSIAWIYAPGPEPHSEADPLNLDGGVTVAGVVALERLTLESPPLVGTVLRYGQLYGPRTGNAAPVGEIAVHVDAAAWAALLATQHQVQGIFNIAEPNGHISTARAERDLRWDPGFRLG
jgi:nucleoside-diphosphate-sugar epimerase